MDRIVFITPAVAIAGAVTGSDFAGIAGHGFKSVVNNRQDGEDAGQLTTREEAVHAWRAGVAYQHVPAFKHELFEDHVVEQMMDALANLPGPVLVHCKSGLRSAILWASASVRSGEPLDCVLATAKAAGFDLEALREEIAGQAGRKRSTATADALDCAAAA